jgi:hypothetical protein
MSLSFSVGWSCYIPNKESCMTPHGRERTPGWVKVTLWGTGVGEEKWLAFPGSFGG